MKNLKNNIDSFCIVLKKLSKKYPDLRTGQIMSNIIFAHEKDLFYMSDKELIDLFNNVLKNSFKVEK